MARTIKPRTFGDNVTVSNVRQAAAAIERAVGRGQQVTVAKVDFTGVDDDGQRGER